MAEYLDAIDAGRSQIIPLSIVAGRLAETLPTGPGLAGWLGTGEASGLEDGALAGMAASYRRLASWAQAGELSVVAELASRSAAANDRVGIEEDGRPVKIPVDACAEVSLALTMSQTAASWWADLAVTLRWRLAATGAALAAGEIDLARARAIAEATGFLDDDTARAVQDRILPKAGSQTTGQLRAALRRAVITADPEGADRRREEAERRAKVMLYPDAEGTASLGGYSLPGIPATAAMARITALARALQASGAGGGIDLLRAHVFIGLLLGTLPYIPPADNAPPDPPHDGQPGEEPLGDDGPPEEKGPPEDDEPPKAQEPPGGEPQDGNPPSEGRPGGGAARGRAPADCPGRDEHRNPRRDRDAAPGHGSPSRDRNAAPADQGSRRNDQGSRRNDHGSPRNDDGSPRNDDGDQARVQRRDTRGQHPDQDTRRLGQDGQTGSGSGPPRNRDSPPPRQDSPHGQDPGYGHLNGHREAGGGDDDLGPARPPPAWPEVPAYLEPGPAAMDHLSPAADAGHLLDLRLDWATLTGDSPRPGYLGRLGPITATQARHLADLATTDPGTRWQIVLTDSDGRAVAITRLVRQVTGRAGLVKQVTLTIGLDCLTEAPADADGLPPELDRILRAARSLASHAAHRAAADAQADGGCAHADATASYQPTTRLRDYITARDQTCRFPTCRQPVWRCDLDHTTPFDQGGRTCSCNLGGSCLI